MSDAQVIRFGRYCLDPTQGLTRGRHELHLTPKSLAVLQVLAERPGQIVAKEDIFRTVWPDIAVTDSTLSSCIQELRHAFGDNAHRPRFIETVHRRGYRFVARTDEASRDRSPLAPPLASDQAPIVGRDAVLETMHAAYALSQRGIRQVLFVAGEPGIGKTTLVSTLVAQVGRRQHVRTAMGQCLEHYGVGEPYQPLLDALTRLCRQPGGVEWIDALHQYAPSWLVQLPLEASSRAASLRAATGAAPARMLRELNDAIEVVTQRAPLLLWLEDLHWCDPSTLDWLAAFAQRPEPARVLLVGTFRTSEVASSNHPLGELADRLRVKSLCRDIVLAGLDEGAVVEYVARRYPCAPGSADAEQRLARLVCQRTGGNPLFVINVLSDLVGRGVLMESGDTWTVRGELRARDLGVSHDIRRMIEREIERVPSIGQQLLEVASVAGATFSSAAVAAGADLPLGDVEHTLVSVARGRRFLRETGAIEWPDGTVATGFEFLHALYRDVLYQRLSAGRRAELHRQIGTRQESAYGTRSWEVAAALAMHFEESRDSQRAVVYLQQAAESAKRRSAYREARLHYERALALLERQQGGHERTERELMLRIGLGSVIGVAKGWGAPEVEDTYVRARDLCGELGEEPRLFPALWGLWLFYWGRGPLSTALELSERLLASATTADDRALRLQAHHAFWATTFSRGELAVALCHAAAGLSVYDADRDAGLAETYGGHDAGACGHSFTARALVLMGRTNEAVQQSHEALAQAQALGQPFSLAIAEVAAAAVDQMRRDPVSTRAHATTAARIAREQEFPLVLAWAEVYLGWVAVEEGRHEEGRRQIRQGVTNALATGSTQFVTSYLALLAEAHLRGSEPEAGLQAIDEALGIADRTGERFYEAELYRLRGELLLIAGPATRERGADGAFERALDISQGQGAKLLAVRAAISRGRLWRRLGRHDEARQLVRASCHDLAESLIDADLLEAQALLRD